MEIEFWVSRPQGVQLSPDLRTVYSMDKAIFAPNFFFFFEEENHESVHRKAVLRAIYRVQGVDAPLLGVFDVKNPCCKTHKQNLRVPLTNIGIHSLVLLLTGSNLMQPKINLCIFAYSKIVPY